MPCSKQGTVLELQVLKQVIPVLIYLNLAKSVL